jgi:N-ethylmaleimide reductase
LPTLAFGKNNALMSRYEYHTFWLIYLLLPLQGRQSHSSFHPATNKIVSASDVKLTSGQAKHISGGHADHEVPTPLTTEEIKETVQDFVNAARYAKEAGFDGVEIHSANGYLVDQFLQSCSNKRTDEYGGSFENRTRFLKEIVEAMIEEGSFEANRIGFRLSPNGTFGDMGSEDNYEMFKYVASEMNKYGLGKLLWVLVGIFAFVSYAFIPTMCHV